ncbi:hypothetical protein AB0O91_28035 [Kitasatospora sp. NPDC089797]|uniref:hypothetical protein n=1 Tax=Kitasatospora sp. NPDC089797 TaxID=3155298 RepID=UPI0034274A6F
MLEEISELAAAGAATVVGAMFTDGWEAARTGFVRLFRRGGQGQETAVEAQLTSGAELVQRAEDTDAARQSLEPLWRFQLAELLRRHPEAVAELTSWVEQSRAAEAQTLPAVVQNVEARDNSRVNAVVHGNVIVHEAAPAADAS